MKYCFARDAAAPDKSRQEQQGKKQTGKGSAHVLFDRIKFCRLGLYSEVAVILLESHEAMTASRRACGIRQLAYARRKYEYS